MTVTAPPRPPRQSEPERDEIEALVEALIEEARKRAQRRRRRNAGAVTLVALVGVAVFAILGRSAQSQTASPAVSARSSLAAGAASSKIAFISEPLHSGYCGVVHVMNPDGSRKRRLTQGGAYECGQEGDPVWSPDGSEIAILSKGEIYVMKADGSGRRRLTRSADFEGSPDWSPDGQKIAFTRSRDRTLDEVDVVNADGSGLRMLTRNLAGSFAPAWSPDGRRIAFVGRRDGNLEIYVMNADGSGQRAYA